MKGFTAAELRVLAAADRLEETTEGMTESERNVYHAEMSRLRRLEREGDAYRRLRADQCRRSSAKARRS